MRFEFLSNVRRHAFAARYVLLFICCVGEHESLAQQIVVVYATGNADGYLPFFELQVQHGRNATIGVGEVIALEMPVMTSNTISINRGYAETRSIRVKSEPPLIGLHINVHRNRWQETLVAWEQVPTVVKESIELVYRPSSKVEGTGSSRDDELTTQSQLLQTLVDILPSSHALLLRVDSTGGCGYSADIISTKLIEWLPDSLLIVERAGLREIFNEQQLQLSGLTESTADAEAGNLIGATHLLIASCNRFESSCFLTVRLIEITTGKLISSELLECQGVLTDVR